MANIDVTTYRDDRVEISTKNEKVARKFLTLIDSLIDEAYTNRDFESLGDYVSAYKECEAQINKVFGKEVNADE